jgi:uncharacterized protein (TIGR02246 family)
MYDLQSAVEAAHDEYIESLNWGDAEEIAAIYTDNAKLLPPNSKIVIGRQAIQSYWQQNRNTEITDVEHERLETAVRDDIAYILGNFSLSFQPTDGITIKIDGKYLLIWKYQAGSWKISVDMWNTDFPLTG